MGVTAIMLNGNGHLPNAEEILLEPDGAAVQTLIRDLTREKRLSRLVADLNKQSRIGSNSARKQARAALERLGFVDVT